MAFNTSALGNYTQAFSNVSQIASTGEFIEIIKPLLFYIIGMVIYAVFIFKFYRFLAKADIIKLKMHKYYEGFEGFMEKLTQLAIYVLENLIVIPILIFFWFIVLAGFILFLSKTHTPASVLPIAMAIVGAVRVTAYYNEELSKDLAKMIPFALLGIFIIEPTYLDIEGTKEIAKQIPQFLDKTVFYLSFVVLLEFVMRMLRRFIRVFKHQKKKEETEK